MVDMIEANPDEVVLLQLVDGFRKLLLTAGYPPDKIATQLLCSGGALMMLQKGREGAIAALVELADDMTANPHPLS